MSAQGNDNFVRTVRERLAAEIEAAKDVLVLSTDERRAGRIQGMQDALLLMNETYRQMTGDPPKQE